MNIGKPLAPENRAALAQIVAERRHGDFARRVGVSRSTIERAALGAGLLAATRDLLDRALAKHRPKTPATTPSEGAAP